LDPAEPIRTAVIGAGHWGPNLIRNFENPPASTVRMVVDRDAARLGQMRARFPGAAVSQDAADAFRDPAVDAVVIATPTSSHYALVKEALEAGKHVLVEKPIAATLDQADHLARLAREKGRVLQVGHLLRYSAEHRAISSRITRPLYIDATRIAPYKPRGTDVSVILDLMIHDLDLVLALVDSPIDSVDAVGAAVSSPHEDIANARVRFRNGCVATITASRISLKTERRMRLFGKQGYLSADFVARKLVMIGRERGMKLPGTGGFRREETTWQDHDALAAEHAAFVAACLDGAPVVVDAAAGKRALAAAIAVADSMRVSRAIAQAAGLI
jgi:predicted dehydrogenase